MTGTGAAELRIEGLTAEVDGRQILNGIDLVVRSGEVHAVMGPNGSGKSTLSHVLMGKPGYTVTGGSVTLDGTELLGLPTWKRAQAGLFLAMQYPIEVPGVSLLDLLTESFAASDRDVGLVPDDIVAEAERIGFAERIHTRALNVDLSGGEKKRNETLQLAVLQPRFAVLDELDSGLDIDALRACARRVEAATNETGLGVLAITHYKRLLDELKPDVVHVLARGRIQLTGGPELADELEDTGYAAYGTDQVVDDSATKARVLDPSMHPGAGGPGGMFGDAFGDPFADPLA
jgi:Fe-S cluster assembly ATP-binding protein